MLFRFCIAVAGILILQACASIAPVAPEATYTPIEIKPQISMLNIPLNIPVKDIEKSVNTYLTGLLYEDNNINDDDMEMKVWKEGAIGVEVIGDEFKFKVPIKVWLKAGFKTQKFGITISDYAETNCSMVIDFTSKIAVGQDWKVSTVTQMTSYHWKTKPALDMVLFDVPLTYFADKIIKSNKESLLAILDEQASSYLQIKSYIDDAWKQIQEPILVYDSPPSYVSIKPVELKMSPLTGRAGVVQTSFGMKAYTQVHMGKKPWLEPLSLPNLVIAPNETGFFSFSLLTDIDYTDAEALTRKYFAGYIFEFTKKKKVKIEEIDLYGNQGKLVMNLKIAGSLNGNLFLSAVPYYDASTKSVKIKNVSFDLDTKNKLLKSADWFAHDIFIKKIESSFVYSLKADLEETKKTLEESMFNKKIYDYYNLEGSLIYFAPETIYLTESGIAALMLVKGTLTVTITDF